MNAPRSRMRADGWPPQCPAPATHQAQQDRAHEVLESLERAQLEAYWD